MRALVACVFVSIPLWMAQPVAAQRQAPSAPASSRLSPEAQLALDDLAPQFAREIERIHGWYRDRPVAYYNMGYVDEPVAAGRVLWPIHGFDAKGNPVAIRGQRPIFSTIPSLGAYSGIWRLTYVVAADHAQPNQLRDMASVDALIRRNRASLKQTEMLLNLPIVPKGSRLAGDSTPAMTGWYEGQNVQFFDFGPVDVKPVAMWRFARGLDSLGQPNLLIEQSSIVDSIPVSGTYPDFWEMYVVRADSAYTPQSLKNLGALQRANMVIDPPNGIRNLPITVIDGVRIERVKSPLSVFADLRSPFPPAPTRPQ